MADIQFYQEDSEEGQDDEADIGLDDYEESLNPDEGLSPLQKVEKYMCSENIYSRQMVARSLLDTIRIVRENQEDATLVLQFMVKISEDSEPSVRTELMEQVPHIAMFCQECPDVFDKPISTYILPVIVRYLMDNNNLVRKTSQAALLVLMEQGLIDNVSIEEHVCPVINNLSSPESMDDFRTEAVALMSKMAPLVGKDITVRFFLPRFTEMCTDALFHVRKVCAANFGDMCNVVGQENTENFLLTKFYYLCEDGVWGVRKACAECFMQVSCACSHEVRRQDLTQLFVGLICDQSRWVRMAAFQCLGSFISTFADPSVTGLYFDDEGVLKVGNPEDFKRNLESLAASFSEQEPSEKSQEKSKAPLASCEAGIAIEDMEVDDEEPPDKSSEIEASTDTHASTLDTESRDDSPKKETESSCSDTGMVSVAVSDSGTPVDRVEDTSPGTSVDMDIDEEVDKDKVESSEDKSPEEIRAIHYGAQMESGLCDTEKTCKEDIPQSDCAIKDSENVKEESHEVQIPAENQACEKETENIHHSVNDNSPDPASCDSWSDSNIGGALAKKSQLSLDIKRPSESTQNEDAVEVQSPESFSSFLYWRDPLPAVDLEADLSPGSSDDQFQSDVINRDNEKSKQVVGADIANQLDEIHLEEMANMAELNQFLNDVEGQHQNTTSSLEQSSSKLHVANESTVVPPGETVANIGSVHVLQQRTMTVVDGIVTDAPDMSNLSYCPIEDAASSPNSSMQSLHESVFAQLSFYIQDVIPQELLDHYLSMTDPSRAQTVDAEIAKHCAYSFPAVAYTLGRKNWNCLRDLYDTLAGDMQWKVRRTLAFSIHELALILGEEITTRDLVPIFNGFLRDLDEVRIGVLKHFADFLGLLSYKTRRDYLTKIPEFLNTDNNRNWRFREDLAQQLMLLLDMYTAEDISNSLAPVAFSLCEDGVSAVRTSAFRVVACLLKKFTTLGEKQLPSTCVNDIVGKFAHNPKWCMRQFYAQICSSILEEHALPEDRFATDMLPSLLALGKDPIPNVRITLAKTLCSHVLFSDYLTSARNPHHEELLATVSVLKQDSDRDVRYFISYQSETDLPQNINDTIPV